jgi:hypothetical protein
VCGEDRQSRFGSNRLDVSSQIDGPHHLDPSTFSPTDVHLLDDDVDLPHPDVDVDEYYSYDVSSPPPPHHSSSPTPSSSASTLGGGSWVPITGFSRSRGDLPALRFLVCEKVEPPCPTAGRVLP